MNKEELKKKKGILDNLYYNIGKQSFDFYLAGTFIKNGEPGFTKWKKYSECVFPIDFDGTTDDWKEQTFFEQINQRQIFPNEIVLDLEEKDQIKPVLEKLKNMQKIKPEEYQIYETGSKGYHIHIFFKYNIKFTDEEKGFIIKQFGGDIQKCSDKTLIALEGNPHWKTGKMKQIIIEGDLI